jgi:hypothetical protein
VSLHNVCSVAKILRAASYGPTLDSESFQRVFSKAWAGAKAEGLEEAGQAAFGALSSGNRPDGTL